MHSAKFENEKSLGNVASAILRHNIGHPVVNDPNGHLWSSLSIACWPTLLVLGIRVTCTMHSQNVVVSFIIMSISDNFSFNDSGPSAQVLFVIVGEGNRTKLQLYIECCIKFYSIKMQLSFRSLPMQMLSSAKPDSPLLFPGKVACCQEDGRLAVSDTGHHRILILSAEGLVLVSSCIGRKFKFFK